MELIRHILVASRPRQWIKNFGLFVPLILDGKLFYPDRFLSVSLGVVAFSFLSSSNYIINDMLDAASDKLHPYKKNRPIAKNDLTPNQALGSALLFGLTGFFLAYTIGQYFLLTGFIFVLLHYLSYFFFRRIAVIDVLMIASGYLLRIMAGEQASGVVMSVWLFLTVLSGSLLLAIGKRRSELSIAQQLRREEFHYSEKVLDSYLAVFASSTFLAYTYFTFLSIPSGDGYLFKGYTEYVFTVIGRKWMMFTVPFVLYGIMRYLQLVYSGREVLINVVTKDTPLLIAVFFWGVTTLFVVYGIGG
jgi:4-hydroxybenzoate polyprenyltransferase